MSKSFTLIEILLSVTLILGLFLAMFFVVGGGTNKNLDEGVIQTETLIKFCQANAANLGKPIKLSFQEATEGYQKMSVLWSPEPLSFPGIFQGFLVLESLVNDIHSLVRIKSENEILFYADGSSENGKISLTSIDENDKREVVIKVLGQTGKIIKKINKELTDKELTDKELTDKEKYDY